MFRILLSAVSFVCLITAVLLLWQSLSLPENLPRAAAVWLAAWFEMFRNPVTSVTILAGAFLLTVASVCVTEILMGLFLSGLSAAISVFCLLGFLGGHYPAVAQYLEKWLQ